MRNKIFKALTFILLAVIFTAAFLPQRFSFATTVKISKELAGKIQSSKDLRIPVIVQTTDGIKERHKSVLQKHAGTLNHELSMIKGFSALVPVEAIDELVREDDVTGISYDYEVQSTLDVAAPAVGAPAYWTSGFTGKGITVAVIDTGIYPHPDLTQPMNRIVGFRDFVNNYSSPYDDNGHGTHVAGIVAGNGSKSSGQYKGAAPEASLVGVKVLDSTGGGRASNVIAGIQWVVQNKTAYGIKVVNLSLGAKATESSTTDPLSEAVDTAWQSGLVVVAAAGNDGPAPGTINTPGINPRIITVGAVDDMGTVAVQDDVIAGFSGRGPTIDGLTKPDLVAPGVNITSLASDTTYLPKKNSGSGGKPGKAAQAITQGKPAQTTITNYYVTMSGTSMATPMVAGTAALLLEQNPAWTPDEVKRQMMSSRLSTLKLRIESS